MNMRPIPASPARLALAAALATISIAIPAVGHAAPPPYGFLAGEGFSFSFSVGAIQAGRARISVGAPGVNKGVNLAAVHGDAQSAPWLSLLAKLEVDYKTLVDIDALANRSVNAVEKGLRERKMDLVLEPAGAASNVRFDIVRPKDEHHLTRTIPGEPVDPIAALFRMRAAPLRDGDKMEFLGFDGPSFYRCQVRVAGHESIESAGEKTAAIRLELVARRVDDQGRDVGHAPRYATIWLSDDEKRIPYRVAGDTDFGRCELELVGYREGRRLPEAASAAVIRTRPAVILRHGNLGILRAEKR